MMNFHKLRLKLQCLTVFRGLLSDPVIKSFIALAQELDAEGGETFAAGCTGSEGAADCKSPERAAVAHAAFAAILYERADNLSDYVKELILADENPYILNSCSRSMKESPMGESLLRDLSALQELSGITPQLIREAAAGRFPDCFQDVAAVEESGLFSAGWENGDWNFRLLYEERIAQLFTRGYGIFAKYHTFVVNDGQLVPVKYPDAQSLSQLSDYEREREQVIKNTQALLSGEPASNVLLYGDAGTGKSSTIKAIANAYGDKGLRLIEVKKNQLYQIPELVESISRNPLKFILFIDDLSFSSNDNDFAALKAILEGSVAGKSGNLAVYATSNRRHLVKETMSAREGDEIHLNDTMQELMSLSARFGLVITFSKPNKDVYLNIVRHLAREYGVIKNEEKLLQNAEAFAIRSGGRSPRVAKQFIELVKADIR